MDSIIANIKYAIRNKENVNIGGGIFTPAELQKIVDLYNQSLKGK